MRRARLRRGIKQRAERLASAPAPAPLIRSPQRRRRVGADPVLARKTLLLDLDELGIPLDNVEGMTFGPRLPDGRQSLVLVSDNNFAATQFTQFLLFALGR
jgi:hypothetical protein